MYCQHCVWREFHTEEFSLQWLVDRGKKRKPSSVPEPPKGTALKTQQLKEACKAERTKLWHFPGEFWHQEIKSSKRKKER